MTGAMNQADASVDQKLRGLETVLGRDVGRNIQPLVHAAAGGLAAAARSILACERAHIGLISGFYVPKGRPPAAENDGPLAVAHLLAFFTEIGIPCRMATDGYGASALAAARRIAGVGDGVRLDIVDPNKPARRGRASLETIMRRWRKMDPPLTHVIAIERCGRASDGDYYNMRGESISSWTGALDPLFEAGPWVRVAVGDGGNEIGMGKIDPSLIAENIAEGGRIGSRTDCDHLIVAGVSNWAGWALPIAMALLQPSLRPLAADQIIDATSRDWLSRINDAGPCVDGVLGVPAESIDGLPWAVHGRILAEMRGFLT